jgi:hypothetical protein
MTGDRSQRPQPSFSKRWRERARRWRRGVGRLWAGVLDLAYVSWVLRVPVVALLAGLLVMGFAPQAQDLIVDLAPATPRVLAFMALMIGWVVVTTYASFLLLGTDRRLLDYAIALKAGNPRRYRTFECFRLGMPYVLGSLPFVIVFVAAVRSHWNLPDIDDKPVIDAAKSSLLWFIGYVFALLVFFVLSSVRRLQWISSLLAVGDAMAGWIDARLPACFRFGASAAGSDPAVRSMHFIGPLLLIVAFLASAGIFIFGPNVVAEWLPRALIVAIVLGGWLPFLTWMSGHGRRLSAPLISGGFLMLAIVSALFGDNHSVRRIVTADHAAPLKNAPPGAPPPAYPEMTLNAAVDLWMEENGCRADPTQCPRPIIVAGAGGASRAGFFTASVIGHMMDGAEHYVASAIPAMTAGDVRKRIFAISGVSGSAVGAVMSVAAMARAGADTKPPCVDRTPTLWYGGEINNWRDCVEALMAGDFLTPVVLGLIFNDRISFGLWQDRAAVLEQSWEDRFAALTGAADRADWQNACPGDLRCAFKTLQPKSGHWLPLLVLNGASSATGRRIVTSILDPNYSAANCPTRAPSQSTVETQQLAVTKQAPVSDVKKDQCLLFLESNSFHKLLDSSHEPGLWTRLMIWLRRFDGSHVLNDVRLSTAAHNSARFPLISPPGALRNRQHQVIDRIVDGGYVENYGALTALEVAQAIHAIQPELAPFVLALSNDPDSDPDLNPLDAPDGAFFSDIMVPIEAILAARTGHGRLAMGQVEAVLDHLAEPACGAQTAHVRVWPQFAVTNSDKKTSRPVSMSWWLSTPIQIHLHQQTELRRTVNRNNDEMGKIWSALDKPPGCVGRPVVPSTVEIQRRMKGP